MWSRHQGAVLGAILFIFFAAAVAGIGCSSSGTGGGGGGGGGGTDPSGFACGTPLGTSCEREYDPGSHVRCTGCPPMVEGKLCATTTRYDDLTEGSCGMGVPPSWPEEVPVTWWTKTAFTAAVDGAFFAGGAFSVSWCPEDGVCGECYRLTPTGGYPDHAGSGAVGQAPPTTGAIVVMVTDDCPGRDAAGDITNNAPWCTQKLSPADCCRGPAGCQAVGNTNQLGYAAHFDLQDAGGQISALGWDNIEVTFEPVDCAEWWAQTVMDRGDTTGWTAPPADPPSECDESEGG